MRSKKKIINSTPEGLNPAGNLMSAFDTFMKGVKQYKDGTNQQMSFIFHEFKRIFGKNPPEISYELVRTKIAYHLLVVEGYQKYNVPVPPKVQKNYEASQELNIEKFSSDMGLTLKLENENHKKEATMVAKKVVKVVKKGEPSSAPAKAKKEDKTPRVTVSGIIREVLAANFTKKLNDEGIAKEINSQAKGLGRGHTYTAKDIPTVRRKFNLGLLSGQEGKPKVELEKVEDKKPEEKKKVSVKKSAK